MATRRAVAASIASAVIFSSLLLSNFVLFSGAAQNFRLVSLASEEREYGDQALVVKSIALLDLLDDVQSQLSAGRFTCSNVSSSVAGLLSSDRVHVGWAGINADASASQALDETLADNLTALSPFSGSREGWTNIEVATALRGGSPDGTVHYVKDENHLLNLPLRLKALTEHCLDTKSQILSRLLGLGEQLCNASILSDTLSSVGLVESASAGSDGFQVSISYAVISTQPCEVAFSVSAFQSGIPGPEGTFMFAEEESGLVTA